MKKTCVTCKTPKRPDQFNFKGGDRKQPYCRSCQNKKAKEHYRQNKQAYVDKAAAHRKFLAELVDDLKRAPCMDCSHSFSSWVMEYDHRPGTKKVAAVAMMVQRGSKEKLLAEIEKCDLVCANCHRERTYRRHTTRVS